MTDAELIRHAEKAIVLALKDDMRGFDEVRAYIAGINDDEAGRVCSGVRGPR